ncbi:MAG: hypothetical protein AAFY71_20410 [Bacteroidota bacterium]
MSNQVKLTAIILATALVFTSCDGGKIKELEQKNAQLEAQKSTQDSLLNDFMSTFNDFESNLETIKQKENLISMNSQNPEMRMSQKDKIVEDIQMINALLDQNRMMIDELNAKAEKYQGQADNYRRMVSSLKKQMGERDTEITQLKEKLASLDFEIDELNGRVAQLDIENQSLARLTSEQSDQITNQEDMISSQTETIESQQNSINTAYYVVGDAKMLKDAAVIIKNKRLNDDFDEAAFTRIDVRETIKIPVNAKKIDLISSHPSDSYMLMDEDQDKVYDYIQITEPANFWKTSRYLVVKTN